MHISSSKEVWLKRRNKAKQELRFLLFKIWLLQLLYICVVMATLAQVNMNDWKMLIGCIFITTLLWQFPMIQLWHYKKIGKLQFALATLCNMLLYYAFVFAGMKEVQGLGTWVMFVLVFSAFALLFGGLVKKLYFSYTIQFLWDKKNPYVPIKKVNDITTKDKPKISEKKAKSMKFVAIRLGIGLYMSLFLLLIIMSILIMQFPNQKDSLYAIQYFLFNQCLYSSMIWAIPMVCLYLQKWWSGYIMLGAFALEIVSLTFAFERLVFLVNVVLEETSLKGLLISFLLFRYLILFYCLRRK